MGTRNLVKFNTSETQLLTISLPNTPSNYPIIFDDSEIPPLNSVNILGLQISSSSEVAKQSIAIYQSIAATCLVDRRFPTLLIVVFC